MPDAVGDGGGAQRFRYSLAYFSLFAIYGVASPYLQLLVRGLGYGPAAVGLFLGLFEVIGIAGPLAIARIADATGRFKPSLFACAALTCLPLAPLVLLRGPAATALCLALLALGLRSMIPVMDAATMAMSSSRPGWDYGRLRAMGSVGFVAVALALQAIPGFDRSPPGGIALWIGLVAAFFGLCLIPLPESGRAGRRPSPAAPAPIGAPSPRARGVSGVFVLGLLVIALGRLAMAPVSSFFSLYLLDEVKWDAVGGMWALAAFSEIPLMILSGRIVSRIGPMRAIALSSAAIAIRLSIYALFPSPPGIVAAQLLHSLCFGLFHPAGVAFVTLMVPPERRAQGMAAYLGFGVGLPTFAGSALGGIVLQSWGYRALFGSFIAFALAAVALYAAKRGRFASA
jgi:MFS transporter, PPP family, 3-phenylpropionic acid transporter